MPPMPPASPLDFASSLRRYRLARGMSQEELAAKAGISVTSVSYLERGLTRLPHRDTVQLLSDALVLTAEEKEVFVQAARRARAGGGEGGPPIEEAMPAAVPADASGQAELAVPSYRLTLPLTPLLGRAHEEATIAGLLLRASVRLLTLTGPAGVGKTRLALQVAESLRAHQDFEPILVDLVAVTQADRVLQAIGLALGVRDAGGLSLLDAVIAAMGDRRLLLVLDNFEHVLEAAPVCAALLGARPRAKALATSRSALNIRGEHEVVVAPLLVPDPHTMPSLAELETYGAVALFVERARAVRHEFAIDTEEAGRLVATICARLDGLPLAIELAAAQVKHFPLDVLAARLQGAASLDLLAGGPRDLADHQRAMRSTVAWSYDLLPGEAQRVFRSMGVFAGGATADGVQMVADLEQDVVASSLSMLVDASLVRRSQQTGDTRYDQLVIVRAFALELLEREGELQEARERLSQYVVSLAEEVKLTATSVQTAALDRLQREHENLRAVLDWVLECGEILTGLRLGQRLRPFWETRGFAVEGAEWLERLVSRAEAAKDTQDLEALVDAWKALVVMNHRLSRFERAAEAGEHILALVRQQGEAGNLAGALNYLANPLSMLGELDRAEAMHMEGLALNREHGNKLAEEITLLNLGDLRNMQGRYEEALTIQQEALEISRSLSEQEASRALLLTNTGETYILMDRPAEAMDILLEGQRVYEAYGESIILALLNLGRAAWRLGTYDDALKYLEQAIHRARTQDDIAALVGALCVVAGVALDSGDLALASDALQEAIVAQPRVSDRRIRWRVVERVAGYACRRGAYLVGARLYAAAEVRRAEYHDLVDPAERDMRARDWLAACETLGEPACVEARQAGREFTLERALDVAHSTMRDLAASTL